MLKKILLALLTLTWFGAAWAAVDVNTATEAQLQDLKGIGPSTARAIVKDRSDHGAYKNADDLSKRVKGLGPKSLAKLEAQGLSVPGGATASASNKGDGEKASPSRSAKASKKS